MCASDCITSSKGTTNNSKSSSSNSNKAMSSISNVIESTSPIKRRRSKRDKNPLQERKKVKKKRIKKSLSNSNDNGNKILTTILPSLAGLVVGVCALAAKLGFRGRATVAGIDLGTTNSVICVQAPSKGVGEIICIPDPHTNSSIIPSVVSFEYLARNKRRYNVIAGAEAKKRIDTHPHSTIYHAKRIIGRSYDDHAVAELEREVEFELVDNHTRPYFALPSTSTVNATVSPEQIGAHILTYLLDITSTYFRHSSITSAVITIPAEFTAAQRIATVDAYKLANIKVQRILEEPTAAALAYGLDKKDGVEHVLVYDFGGGTLDVSVLRIGQNGYVDVMGSAGDSNLGGADFDDALVNFISSSSQLHNNEDIDFVQRFHNILKSHHTNEEDLFTSCTSTPKHTTAATDMYSFPLCTISSLHGIAERIKIQLSSNPNITSVTEYCVTFDSSAVITDPQTQEPSSSSLLCPKLNTQREITITLKDYHEAVQHLYPLSVLPIRKVLSDLDLKHEDIDEVVMVGGTTRMLHIRELVKEELHVLELNTLIDPDITVAYGAASVID